MSRLRHALAAAAALIACAAAAGAKTPITRLPSSSGADAQDTSVDAPHAGPSVPRAEVAARSHTIRDPQAHAALSLWACLVPGDTIAARCGTLRVPEKYSSGGGRRIDLNLLVVPARGGDSAPDPILVLAGGPGQAATSLTPLVQRLAAANLRRDLVFVDQRGAGGSNPLTCPGAAEGPAAGFGPEHDAYWEACLEALGARADLRAYTTAAAVADFDAVRSALGYPAVNLVAGSYGTRVAQLYMRLHPHRVRSAVLWAVAPMGYDIPAGGGLAVQAALERLLTDCAADLACASAFPRFGERMDSLLTILAAHPVRTGSPLDDGAIVIDADLFAQTVLALLFDAAHTRRLPALVDQAARGEWSRFAGIAAQVQAGRSAEPDGLYLSVLCNEDVPHIRPGQLERFRGAFGGQLREAAEEVVYRCARWPKADVSPDLLTPIPHQIPVFLLSGEIDPATPPAGAERALQYLRNARHVEVPATSHGPIFPGCVAGLVAEFLADPRPDQVDAGCVAELEWPPFSVPRRP